MATTTTYLGLRKPATSDLVNVTTDISDNMDLIDVEEARRGLVTYCTASTRPTVNSTNDGRILFETDTYSLKVVDNTNTTYTYGHGFYSSTSTSNSTITGSEANILSISNIAMSSKSLARITFKWPKITKASAGSLNVITLRLNYTDPNAASFTTSTQIVDLQDVTGDQSGGSMSTYLFGLTLTGNYTIYASGQRTTGATTTTMGGAAGQAIGLFVEVF